MKPNLIRKNTTLILLLLSSAVNSQSPVEKERQQIIDDLISSRDVLFQEAYGLSKEQWLFEDKQVFNNKSINKFIESLALHELEFVSMSIPAFYESPRPGIPRDQALALAERYIEESRPRTAVDSAKQFWGARPPLGLNDGPTNLKWFYTMRNISIEFLKTIEERLKSNPNYNPVSINNRYKCDLQLIMYPTIKDIRNVKKNLKYPK